MLSGNFLTSRILWGVQTDLSSYQNQPLIVTELQPLSPYPYVRSVFMANCEQKTMFCLHLFELSLTPLSIYTPGGLYHFRYNLIT